MSPSLGMHLIVREFPVVYPPILHEKCELDVEATIDGTDTVPESNLVQSRELSWEITDVPNYGLHQYKLKAKCT